MCETFLLLLVALVTSVIIGVIINSQPAPYPRNPSLPPAPRPVERKDN
jgi:hypothetical protein